MIRDKKLILALVLLFVGCVILIITAISNSHTQTAVNTTAHTSIPHYSSLHIDNFSSYWGIDATTQTTIEGGIDHYLGADTSKSRLGTIRRGSFQRKTNGPASTTVFLVDIPNLKKTYKVSIGNDTSTSENSLYILCPSNTELVYPPSPCKDDLSERP